MLARGTDGEDGYTPVKGVDYFTEEEIQQIQNEVSGGAIGDFKAVVDEKTATFNTNAENTLTDYNANAQEKFDTYNTNADSKFETYNTNAETKFSEYNTNAEAKLSEYNKNDLDKTALYNTNADSKFTTYNENAEAKFSEYTSNAETKLSEYNQNDSDKMALYNANAENKLSAYDSNAQAKFDLYNQNDSEKTEAYNSNAQTKLSTYDSNAEQKLESYNQNHTEKLAEYNQNAETKMAEFDANAAALQTEVDRLRGECDNLAAENRKQEDRIDALIKLNKGQTYDVLEQESEAYSVDVPSGAKYVSIDKVGGKSVVWNQLVNPLCLRPTSTKSGLTFTNNGNGSITVSGTATSSGYIRLSAFFDSNAISVISGHKHYCKLPNVIERVTLSNDNNSISVYNENQILSMTANGTVSYDLYFTSGVTYNYTFKPQIFDLTLMFGAGNEPTAKQFDAMFPADYYPYCEPTIISSQTDRVDTVGFNQWDEEWEKINVNISNGNTVPSTTTIGSKNFCPILPSTAYYATCGKTDGGSQNKYYLGLIFYDENKQYISSDYYNNLVFTTPEKARFFKITTNTGTVIYGNTYNHDICINLSDPSRNGKYEPYSLQQITTNFPVLNSAGSVYDYIDLNEGKLHQRVGVVDLGTLNWGYQAIGTSIFAPYMYTNVRNLGIKHLGAFSATVYNIICQKYTTVARNPATFVDKTICADGDANAVTQIQIKDSAYTDAATFKAAMSGVMLYYELTEEVITDIDIPTEFTEWLPVEAGGTVTFRNADESKQLAVPNAVSWVRKLNEVE